MASINQWSTTASSNNAAVPDGAPENWVGADINNTLRECMASVRTWYDAPQWLEITYALSPAGTKTLTRVSTTQIDVVGCDATTYFTAGRQIQIVGATTGTGFVVSSAYSASDTQVTVTMVAADVPVAPTSIKVFCSDHLGDSAFVDQGTGNGLDADTVDGFEAADLAASVNHLINGGFDVWQRGTPFTSISSAQYTADRWRYDPSTGSATITRVAHALGQTNVPNEPSYYLLAAQSSAASTPLLEQRIENVRTLAGQQVTLSFYAVGGTSFSVDTEIEQNFGTGGSPSTAVTTAGSTASVTTSWTRFTHTITIPSISGKTLGTGGDDYLAIRFKLPAASSVVLSLADVQVETGSSAASFVRDSFADVLDRCQRYYFKTFDYGTAPAQATGSWAGAIVAIANSGGGFGDDWRLPGMRAGGAAMTVTTYNPSQANANWRFQLDTADGTVFAFTNADKGERAVFIEGNGTANSFHFIHATAEAEL